MNTATRDVTVNCKLAPHVHAIKGEEGGGGTDFWFAARHTDYDVDIFYKL